jgi:hypothetical protein
MRPWKHCSPWIAAAGAALVLSACVDRDNPAAPGQPPGTEPTVPAAEPVLVQALDCRADMRTLQVQCENRTGGDGLPNHLIVGGQNTYVTLTSANPNYDPGTGAFTIDVTVRNLIPQPLGTADTMPALTPDPDGVRVFFSTPPEPTAGTGAIDVVEDGQAIFTGGAPQDYYQYNTVLEQYELSAPRTWQFTVPNTVETFAFAVLVSTAVPYPDGYVLVSGNFNVLSGNERQLTARAYNVVGEEDPVAPSFTWNAVDSTRAKVDGTGMVHGQRAGATAIVATEAGGLARHGKVVMNVAPIRRTWTGATGTTNWETGANWLPDSIPPQPTDTAVVNDVSATIFPELNQNESVGGVEVLDITPGGVIPSIDLGAFNLDASGSVITNEQGEITGTVGRLNLTGTAQTVEGLLPRTTVTGTYSLSGNVTSRASTRVQGGRLRTTGFRIRTLN